MAVFAVAILTVLLGLSASYPSGAPEETCQVFTAQHENHKPQNSEPPYTITFTPASVQAGGAVRVTIKGIGGEKFKGFFIQGQDQFKNPIGKFRPNASAQTRDCSGSADSATHVNSQDKGTITLDWNAPTSYKGPVTFRSVIVKSFEVHWNNLKSITPLNVV